MSETRELGTIVRRWVTRDDDGVWEHREQLQTIAECPRCRKDVECTAETDGWTETRDGSKRWKHDSYGPAMGECCGLVIADWWEGTFAFDPSAEPDDAEPSDEDDGPYALPEEFEADDECDFTEEDVIS